MSERVNFIAQLFTLVKESSLEESEFFRGLLACAKNDAVLRTASKRGEWTSRAPNPLDTKPAIDTGFD